MANNVKEAIDVASDTLVRKAIWRTDFSKVWPFALMGVAAVPLGIYAAARDAIHLLARAWGIGQ